MVKFGYIHVISILSTNGKTAYLVVECCCIFCLFVCTCPGTANCRKRSRSTADSYQTRLEAFPELRREELEVKKQQTEKRKQELELMKQRAEEEKRDREESKSERQMMMRFGMEHMNKQ